MNFPIQILQGYSALPVAALRGYDDVLRVLLDAKSIAQVTLIYKLELVQLALRCDHLALPAC